jgi:hypothetical protein
MAMRPIAFDRTCYRIDGEPVYLNEMTGIHAWFGGLDYHEVTMGLGQSEGRYPRFLRGRYGEIEALSRAYETDYHAFEEVRPPYMVKRIELQAR